MSGGAAQPASRQASGSAPAAPCGELLLAARPVGRPALWPCPRLRGSECRGRGLCDRRVLIGVATADADRADELAVALERDAASEDHHATLVGLLDAVERASGLGIGSELGRRQVERP